uniref:PCI domain-containing protein n=1 Tax=Soboliphyme baturini TaxID=241478 RepID=A0A183J3E6_9BILA
LIHDKHDLLRFLERTLFYIQHKENSKNLADLLENALRYLVKTRMVKLNKIVSSDLETASEISFAITSIGKAVFKSGIEIDLATQVYNDLRNAISCLCLSSQLHLLYCMVPYDLQDFQLNWDAFYDEDRRFRLCARMYLALILKHMFMESDVWTVAERFQVTRGFVQSLVQSAASFGSSLVRFVEANGRDYSFNSPDHGIHPIFQIAADPSNVFITLNTVLPKSQNLDELWALKSLLPDFVKQVAYCTHSELIPLMEISGVKKGRAVQLFKNGFTSVNAVANSSVSTLVRSIQHLSRAQAKQIIDSAKMIMHEKIEILLEQAESMLGAKNDADVSVDDIVATLRQSV